MDIKDTDYPKIDGHIILWEDSIWYKYDETKDEWEVLTDHPPSSESENA